MSRKIVVSTQYKKDLKKSQKQGLPIEELDAVIKKLVEDVALDAKFKDHQLVGQLKDFRECHIKPDWLLLYSKEGDDCLKILRLVRLGSHAELFGM